LYTRFSQRPAPQSHNIATAVAIRNLHPTLMFIHQFPYRAFKLTA